MRSMTAFASKQLQGDWGSVTWELKSVNHRFLELSLRLPDLLRDLESELRAVVRKQIARGKLECTLRYQAGGDQAQALTLNMALVQSLMAVGKQLNDLAQQALPLRARDLINWPGLVNVAQPKLDELKPIILSTFTDALQQLLANREREGESIRPLLLKRLEAISEQAQVIHKSIPEVLTLQREKLLQRFEQAKIELDENRLEQEMVLYAQKIDISEELERLMAHIAESVQVIERNGVMGRRLDFLMQELNREANTLTAKATSKKVIAVGVEIKVIIEQLREQIQNIE